MILRKFYEELGGFLYAIARSDGAVQPREQDTLEREINGILNRHPGFEDHPEYKELMLTKLNFNNAIRENRKVSEAMHAFLDFVNQHARQIPKDSKQIALHLIRSVSSAFHGNSRMESGMIRQLLEQLEEGSVS